VVACLGGLVCVDVVGLGRPGGGSGLAVLGGVVMIALESSLVKGLVEALPEPGTVMSLERRRKWVALAERVLDHEYLLEDAAGGDVGGSAPEVLQLEARPVSARHAVESAAPVPSKKKRPPWKDSPAGAAARVAKAGGAGAPEGGRGALKAAVRACFSGDAGQMTLAQVCVWLIKHRREAVAHLSEPSKGVYQCLWGMVQEGEMRKVKEGKVVYFSVDS
jgi:hypothetical protein